MTVAWDIITIDVEEWFHDHNYLETVQPGQWADQESRVEKGMQVCLDLLDRHGAKATFFVLGWTAERNPDLVREMIRRGHEVGCRQPPKPLADNSSAGGPDGRRWDR